MTKVRHPTTSTMSVKHSVIFFILVSFCCSVQGVVTPLNPQLSYLPGVGTFINPLINTDLLRVSRSQSSPVINDNLDNPFLAPNEAYSVDEPLTTGSGQPLEPFQPPLDAGDGKCSYVQMKGGPLPRAECQAGGMACTKDCNFDKGSKDNDNNDDDADVDLTGPGDASDGSKCVTVTERMCGDVPKEECETVLEKVCEQIPDEICEEEKEGAEEKEPDKK